MGLFFHVYGHNSLGPRSIGFHLGCPECHFNGVYSVPQRCSMPEYLGACSSVPSLSCVAHQGYDLDSARSEARTVRAEVSPPKIVILRVFSKSVMPRVSLNSHAKGVAPKSAKRTRRTATGSTPAPLLECHADSVQEFHYKKE